MSETPTSVFVRRLRFYNIDNAAADRLEALQAQVDAVRTKHQPSDDGYLSAVPICLACSDDNGEAVFPCETIRALDGDKR